MASKNVTEYFRSGPNQLSCIFTAPDLLRIRAGMVFVHAADGNRLGPHRMFVELADRLKALGTASMRFDMRGCGDSEGDPAGNDITADIDDLRHALRYFETTFKPSRIFLFGISRGARVCIQALAEHELPVDGAILLSTPFSGSKAAVRMAASRIKEYGHKIIIPGNLKKLITGKIRFRRIAKTLSFALTSQKRYRRDVHTFSTRCPLLFIYGSKDPIAADSAVYYSTLCNTFRVPYTIVNINNANHSYYHYKWKEQIFQYVEDWFMQNPDPGGQR